jgi:adenylyltransferase/sulfurtransferase
MLSPEENSRYKRHLSLDKVGVSGQEKLKAAKVLVIGAGGLGCPVLQYLTAAGVGRIGIIDFDIIEKSNLQRQVLFTDNDLGKSKAIMAAHRLEDLNPLVNFEVYNKRLTPKIAIDICDKYDIIVDGTDNFSTRYLINDACILTNKPLVYGSIHKFEGQVSVFNYQNGPTYRCLFPIPPNKGNIPNCSEVGVLGILPGIIGSMQANEVLKIILEIGEPLAGKLLVYNALSCNSTTLSITKSDQEIEAVISNKTEFEKHNYETLCESKQTMSKQLKLAEFYQIDHRVFQIIDVRETWEEPRIDDLGALIIPLNELHQHFDQISRDKEVIVCCQKGIRSKVAIDYLNQNHNFTNLINLSDGLSNYKKQKK